MRIGIDARILCAGQLKGIGRYLQYLLDHLGGADGDYQYVVFYDPKHAVIDRLPQRENITSVPVAARTDELWEQWVLPRAAKKAKLDLFHSPANTTMLWPPCPTVVTLHDAMSHQAARGWGRLENFYWNGVQRWAYRGARRFITPTRFAKQQLLEELGLPDRSIAVIYHGVGETYRPASSVEIERWMERYRVARPYVFIAGGRLSRKNIPTALRAFELVAQRTGRIQLVVSGVQGVPLIEQIVAQLRCRDRIRLLPHLDEPDLIPAYSGAELFVFPSLRETFGFPPLEAMACGTPVVASNATCIPEVVGDAAYLVDCRDPKLLADAIVRVLGDEDTRMEFVQRGLAHVKRFRWERAAQETLRVYQEALSA